MSRNHPPRVSVVIPCKDYGRFLVEAVQSVLQQGFPDLEIIVVDDGSQDETRVRARDLARSLGEGRDGAPTLRLISQECSGQPAKSRNRGIAEARGRYILCLDADDRLEPGSLGPLAACLDDNPQVAIAYGDQRNFGEREGFEAHPEYDARRLTLFNFIPPASLFRRSLWETIGGFRTNVIGYEDWDFWVAALAIGGRGRHVPGVVWNYRHHGGGLYARQVSRDRELKAQVVLNNASVYGSSQIAWAKAVIAGETWAAEVSCPVGVVPQFHGDTLPDLPESESSQGEMCAAPPVDSRGVGGVGERVRGRRILFTMYGWEEEGGGTMLPRGIAKALQRRGHSVGVIVTSATPKEGSPPYHVTEREDEGVRIFEVHNRPAIFADPTRPGAECDDPRMRSVVRHLVQGFNPDLVHVHSMLSFSLAFLEDLRAQGIPILYTSHNYWPVCPRMYLFQEDLTLCSGPAESGVNCAVCTGAVSAADDFSRRLAMSRDVFGTAVTEHIAVSHRVRELFIRAGHDPANISVLQQQPEGVDALWTKTGARRVPAPAEGRPLEIAFIGSLLPQKGIHVLVKALQALPRGAVRAQIHGSGPEAYVRALRQLDASGACRFHGRFETADLPRLLADADVLAVPSIWEDCAPLVVAEGLAARLPILGSRIGGIPDFVEDGVTGLLVAPGDAPAWTEAIHRFVREPQLLPRMQEAIDAPRGFDAYLDALTERYEHALNGSTEAVFESVSEALRPSPATDRDVDGPPSVVWEGTQFVQHSLAIINREICSRLLRSGVDLGITLYEPHKFSAEGDPRWEELSRRFGRRPEGPVDVHVRHQWPPRFDRPAEGAWVVIQPWEFGSMPRDWVRPFRDEVDEIWVPSSYVRDVYTEGGVPAEKIVVIPNGFDPKVFHPEVRPMDLPTSKSFRFLFVGGTIARKGIHGLLSAYLASFTDADDVVLVIKDLGSRGCYRGATAGDLIREVSSLPGAPEILHLEEELEHGDLASLYAAADVLVHPYLGEGFGMPILEAMAVGKPVVVTGMGAALDFVDDSVGYLIPARKQTFDTLKVGDLECVQAPWLAAPDLEALGRVMRELAERPAEALRRGERGAQRALRDYTWDRVTQRVETRLRALSRRGRVPAFA